MAIAGSRLESGGLRVLEGFTLIELMVTLAVFAVLLTLAVPSFNDLIRRNQTTSASNALLADLSYARSEAVTRGTMVSICPTTQGTSCAAGRAFATGWIVYAYLPGQAVSATAYDSTKTTVNVLLRYTIAQRGVSIQSNYSQPVSFGPQGQTAPQSTNVAFLVCHRASDAATGVSSTTVPGVVLNLMSSGSVISQKMGSSTNCTPP